MTDKMKFAKGVLLMLTTHNFDNDYLDKVFDGVINMETFGDMLVVEFIKRAYDKAAPTYPLRHFVPYGADANDVRMLYSRVMAYVQRYRDQEYTEMSQRKGIDTAILKALTHKWAVCGGLVCRKHHYGGLGLLLPGLQNL